MAEEFGRLLEGVLCRENEHTSAQFFEFVGTFRKLGLRRGGQQVILVCARSLGAVLAASRPASLFVFRRLCVHVWVINTGVDTGGK